jgi:hypothetical protein
MSERRLPRFAQTLKFRITVGEKTLTGMLNNSATGRDFAGLLPLTLTLSDYHRTEKVSDLPQKLSTQDAPPGFKASTGDLTYYAPWGNLAIFYKDFPYASGLIPLGKIDSDVSPISSSSHLTATIELDYQNKQVMIHTFKEGLRNLLQIGKRKGSCASQYRQYTQVPGGYFRALKDDAGEEELRLYRLEQHGISHFLTVPGRSSWIGFYLHGQSDRETFLTLCKYEVLHMEKKAHGILISIAPNFLTPKMSGYLRLLQGTADRSVLLTAVTNKQNEELHGIIDKIESLMASDYVFRKHYIQELVMQLIHFLLKRSGSPEHKERLLII